MTKLELAIAWRYLRSRRGSRLLSLISVIAIGGVLVGVSALIVIMGVMNGLQTDLRDKILIGSPDIRVLSYGEDLKISDWKRVLDKVRRQPGVVAAGPFVMTQGIATAGHDYSEGVNIVGIPPTGQGPDVTSIRQHGEPGKEAVFRFAPTAQGKAEALRGVVLGKLLASRLNAYPGDRLTLYAAPGGGKLNPVTGMPNVRSAPFEVSGLFESGMYEYDNSYVFLPLDAAQDLAGLGDAVTGVEVKTRDRWEAKRVAEALTDSLGFPYRTVDWQEQNRSLFQALKLEKLGMAVILLLIVLVAAFNIVSTLTMVVADKTKEIGILRAMGMKAGAIRRIFFLQGVVIGLVGTILGLALGLGVAMALDKYKFIALDPTVYFIDHLPVAIQVSDVALIVLSSLAVAALATLYPARQAARLFPVEAIRHE